MDEFYDRRGEFHWMDYKSYVSHLEDMFGRENVLLYVFERDQMPGGPIPTFARIVGVELDDSFTKPPKRNASLTPEVSEMLRCLPLDEAPTEYRVVLDRAAAKVDAKIRETQSKDASSLILSHEQRSQILEEQTEGNAWVAERYFDRAELFHDPIPTADDPVAELKLPDNSYDTMQTLVAPLIRALIDINKANS